MRGTDSGGSETRRGVEGLAFIVGPRHRTCRLLFFSKSSFDLKPLGSGSTKERFCDILASDHKPRIQ